MVSTKPARGTRDFLPADVRRRQHVIDIIKRVYQSYGFEPLETPAVENIETLLGQYGDEGEKLVFKILKRGEGADTGQADLALRYDLTVPLARVVAEHQAALPKFFKRYQIQPVWRADRPQKGRYREFYQCDVDALGSTSPIVEVELCSAVSDVLHALGFSDFTIVVNHRSVLAGWLSSCGIPEERHGTALIALDKLDKVGLDGVAAEWELRGFDIMTVTRLRNWLDAAWDTPWVDWISAQMGRLGEAGRAGAENLKQIMSMCEFTSANGHVKYQPSLARGLSYYTGAVFEIRVPDLAGSLGGGGRYDNLVGTFSKKAVPAAGFSLGLERILVVMDERGMFPPVVDAGPADILVTVWTEETRPASLNLARAIRAAGLRVELYPEPANPGHQFAYAQKRNIRYAAVVGELGGAASSVLQQALIGFDPNVEVLIKDLVTREQFPIQASKLFDWLSSRAL